MTQHGSPHDRHDDRLRAHLRSADPAAHLAPSDPATLRELTRSAMSDAGGPGTGELLDVRRHLPQLLAAAAAVVVVGAGTWAVVGPDDDADGPSVALDPAPTVAAEPRSSPAPAGSTAPGPGADTMTVLRVPQGAAAKCMVPNADVLRRQDLAFKGTVTALEGDLAVLDASRVFAGDVSDVVRVQTPPAETAMLLAGVQFEVGGTYLVSATGGQVTLCGLSAEAGPELAALYAEAYGG